jgi:hypothetical protein
MKVSGQLPALVTLSLGIYPTVSIGRGADWTPEPVWTLWRTEKSLALAGDRTPIVQPIV